MDGSAKSSVADAAGANSAGLMLTGWNYRVGAVNISLPRDDDPLWIVPCCDAPMTGCARGARAGRMWVILVWVTL